MSARPGVSSTGSYGHPSRRDNHSISSNHSSSSRADRSERGSTRQGNHPAVESTVTRLLVSIKVLLEALTNWSELKVDENHVSDVYVQLGNDFNAAVAAFSAFNIDLSELLSVPEDLRMVLEQCLSEEATKENLEIYLPDVRRIITNLLQGLRGKQSIYRKIVSDHRHRSGEAHERTESRSSRGSRSHRSQLSRSGVTEEERSDAGSSGNGGTNGSVTRRSAQSSGRRRQPDSLSGGVGTINEEPFIGGFAPSITQQPTPQPAPSLQEPQPAQETQHTRQRSRAGSVHQSPPLPPPPTEAVERKSSPLPPEPPAEKSATPPPHQAPVVPPSVKRYSLVDKPIAPTPEVLVEPSSPKPNDERPGPSISPPPENIIIESSPVVASSLAALKNSDVLERRASKRFSTYNISKMTGATTRERSLRGHPNRRSLAASNTLTPGELAVLTEVDDEEAAGSSKALEPSLSSRRPGSRPTTPQKRQDTPPVPVIPATPSRTPEPPIVNGTIEHAISGGSREPNRFTVFLQVGREVKKVTVEPGISFAALRVLFVDKFAYNPGLENFPAIYIRDPSSGVQYELEDTDEVKDKCLLSLNIEPLDQIKQHIDSQISSLSQDIKELKTAISTTNNSNNFIRPPSHIPDFPAAESTPAPNRPTDRQFQHVARRLSRFMGDASPGIFESSSMSLQPQFTGMSLQPQMTGASVLSDYTSRVVTDLKTQFDEVQNLRRDLGVIRQLYTQFMKQTKESLGTLRTQTQSVKQLATSHVGGARAYIDSGKKKLDSRSQNVLTEVEKLQDAVENVKDDVIKRQITPKGPSFKNLRKDIDAAAVELESLKEHIQTIKPMWKKTWEEELQNIVEEQQFLTHQEEFLNDLLEDHKSVVEIYEHIEKVISLRGSAPRKSNFRPPPPDEGHTGLSTVMMEIRGAAVDPEKRLKAIEASQRNREKEKAAARTGELQAEITDFVSQKKLKMTGGAEEAERVRQKRNEQTLKAMFTGGSASPSFETYDVPSPTPST